MGNLTFIVPTENKQHFNKKDVVEMLKGEFTNLIFEVDNKWNCVKVRKKLSKKDAKKFRDFVMDIYFAMDCYILDINRDIKQLEDIRDEEGKVHVGSNFHYWDEQVKELKKLKNLGYNNDDLCIQTTYGAGYYTDIKNDIDFFLRDTFKGYIFDEGIHPEFMGPSYERKPKRVKKFKFFK